MKRRNKHCTTTYIKLLDNLLNSINNISAYNAFFKTKLQIIAGKKAIPNFEVTQNSSILESTQQLMRVIAR